MAKDVQGSLRYNLAQGVWQVFIDPPGEWQTVTGTMGEILAPFDDFRDVEGVREYHVRRGDDTAWWTEHEASASYFAEREQEEAEAEEGKKAEALRPPDWNPDIPWPPRDADGSVNWGRVTTETRVYETRRAKAQAEIKEKGAERYEAQARAGPFQMGTPAASMLKGGFNAPRGYTPYASVDQQGGARPARSVEALIAEALVTGDWDRALAFDDFRQRPSRLEVLRFAMQYAETPEEFQALLGLAQGFLAPAAIAQAAQGAPVVQQAQAFAPPQGIPPTTAELQAQGAQRFGTQVAAPFNLPPSVAAQVSGVQPVGGDIHAAERAAALAEEATQRGLQGLGAAEVSGVQPSGAATGPRQLLPAETEEAESGAWEQFKSDTLPEMARLMDRYRRLAGQEPDASTATTIRSMAWSLPTPGERDTMLDTLVYGFVNTPAEQAALLAGPPQPRGAMAKTSAGVEYELQPGEVITEPGTGRILRGPPRAQPPVSPLQPPRASMAQRPFSVAAAFQEPLAEIFRRRRKATQPASLTRSPTRSPFGTPFMVPARRY